MSTDNVLHASFLRNHPTSAMESSHSMNDFAERLKHLRKQHGLSQTELGQRVDVHYNHIGRYERAESRPSADTLARLADVLGVSSDYLIEGTTDAAAKADFEDRELMQQFLEVQQFSPQDKQLVKEFLDAFITKKKLQSMVNVKLPA